MLPRVLLFYAIFAYSTCIEVTRKYEFQRHQYMKDIDCKRIAEADCQYLAQVAKNRVNGDEKLPMDCDSVWKRVVRYSEYPVVKNPVAFVKVVYQIRFDLQIYSFLEEQLAFTYHPDHQFCFSMDGKVKGGVLEKNLKILAQCVPNVHFAPKYFNINSSGNNMSYAFHACWEILVKQPKWNYLLDMQNYDIITKTAVEISDIVDVLNGSNAVQLARCDRCKSDTGYFLNGLGLYPDEKHFSPKAQLKYAGGLVQNLVSRAAIDFLFTKVNITKYLSLMNFDLYAIDEIFLPSLQHTDEIGLPGGMTSRCLIQENHHTEKIVRYSTWDCSGKNCSSGVRRHCICMLGIEELPALASYPHVLANKMFPYFDYGAIQCVGELLYNRTYGFSPSSIKAEIFGNLTHTRFTNFMSSHSNSSAFNCSGGLLNETGYFHYEKNWFSQVPDANLSLADCQKLFPPSSYPTLFPKIQYLPAPIVPRFPVLSHIINDDYQNQSSNYELIIFFLFLLVLCYWLILKLLKANVKRHRPIRIRGFN